MTIAAAAGLGLFYLSQSTHVAAIGYQIDALQAHVAELRAEQQQLTFQIGEARSPSHDRSEGAGGAHADPARSSRRPVCHQND